MAKVDVAIIGSGHNGLVAATYLARQGLSVELFEKSETLGGATRNEELFPGYTFSTGAHLLHAVPAFLAEDFRLFERGLELVPRAKSIFLKSDGTYDADTALELPNNRTAWSKLSAEERDGLTRYENFKHQLSELVRPYLTGAPPSIEQLRERAAGTPAAEALQLATSMDLWALQDHFLPTDRLRQRVSVDSSAVSCNPEAFSLAYLAIDGTIEAGGPAPLNGFVRGGMGKFAGYLIEAAEEAGVVLHAGRGVRRILVEEGRATGLELEDGERLEARTVLAACDTKTTFLRLLAAGDLDASLRRRIDGLVSNVSCYKLLAAIDELPEWRGWDGDPELPARGAMQLEMTREVIREIYDDVAAGRPPRRPMLSFNIPSMDDPTLAPAGRQTASIYIYSAPGRLAEGTWDDIKEREAERVIDYITSFAPNFRRSIIDYEFRTPLDLERRFGLTDGCIWHVQHTAEQILGGRPLPELSGYRSPIQGLYMGDCGQHPGGEVCGLPGHNAAGAILADLGLPGPRQQ